MEDSWYLMSGVLAFLLGLFLLHKNFFGKKKRALACTLAKDGWRVHVIERDLSEQDRIVGELLQPGGYLKLLELDLADCVEEIDTQRIMGYALYKDGKSAHLSYPLRNFTSDVAGRGFHNGRFIQRMREKAATLSKYTPFLFEFLREFGNCQPQKPPVLIFFCSNQDSRCSVNNSGERFNKGKNSSSKTPMKWKF